MSKYLCETEEIYRVDTEEEANVLIEKNKNQPTFKLIKYSSQYKTRKEKKEVVDEYWIVSLTKLITDIKDPDRRIKVDYSPDEVHYA